MECRTSEQPSYQEAPRQEEPERPGQDPQKEKAFKLAIVGSRQYPNLDDVARYVDLLPRSFTVVSGGAEGVDSTAVIAAQCVGIKTVVYPADWDKLGKVAGFVRNEKLVKASDKVVAFWDVASHGTAHAIRCAMMEGKLLKVFTPFGVLRVEKQ